MRYRIAFSKRLQSDGGDSGVQPSAELDLNLADGIVAEKEFVEQLESDAQHSQDALDEDDAFLGSATPEVWEYEVVNARAAEFEEAIRNSDLVLEYDIVDNAVTTADEISAGVLSNRGVYPRDNKHKKSRTAEATAAGSGMRAVNEEEVLGEDESDLNVTTAKDPRLGLSRKLKRKGR